MRPASIARGGVIAGALVLVAVPALIVLLSALLDAGYLRGPLLRVLAAKAARSIKIDGALKTHLLARSPSVTAERVTIGNPPWTRPGTLAEIGKLTFVLKLPFGGRSFAIERLGMDGVVLHLARDTGDHANWQRTDPVKGPQGPMPVIQNLSMTHVAVELDDALRKLQFRGTVSAGEVPGESGARALRLEGDGELNGRQAAFEVTGDPLAAAASDHPYGFKFSESSSGSRLSGSGTLLKTFDFDNMDVSFEAAGEDLADLYFLTGVTLVNTGRYRLSGKLERRGTHTHFSDVEAASGQSGLRADVSIESCCGRPKIVAEIDSQRLRMADLGLAAAGRDHDPDAGKFLLSKAVLKPSAVRQDDWLVQFHAAQLDVGRIPMQAVSAKMTIDRGVLVMSPLSAEVFGGKLSGRVKFDARTDRAVADVDVTVLDARIGPLTHKDAGSAPLDGSLRARLSLKGPGRSLHEVAASADGTVAAVLTQGTIRASLAELTGIDLRGLGLLLAKSKRDTGVRCGVVNFQSHDGTWVAQRLVMDTDPVVITGAGELNLGSESLDLELRGHPKTVRLFRLKLPVLIRGTLVHPVFRVGPRDAGKQAAEAAVPGAAPPLAATLAFVDKRLEKDADCVSLQDQERAPPH